LREKPEISPGKLQTKINTNCLNFKVQSFISKVSFVEGNY
jgi:hypothetical protein